MKKSIFALLFGMMLMCFGLCFVVDDAKASPDIQKISVCDFAATIEAPSVNLMDHVPIVSVSHETSNDFEPVAIHERRMRLATTVEHRQRYWRNRSWGKTQKILKFPSANKGKANVLLC